MTMTDGTGAAKPDEPRHGEPTMSTHAGCRRDVARACLAHQEGVTIEGEKGVRQPRQREAVTENPRATR